MLFVHAYLYVLLYRVDGTLDRETVLIIALDLFSHETKTLFELTGRFGQEREIMWLLFRVIILPMEISHIFVF